MTAHGTVFFPAITRTHEYHSPVPSAKQTIAPVALPIPSESSAYDARYTVDDGTGEIGCTVWANDNRIATGRLDVTALAALGDLVVVRGKVRSSLQ